MRIGEVAGKLRAGLLGLLFPPHCVLCRVATKLGKHVCEKCLRQARAIEAPYCHQCSQPFDGAISGAFVCSNCEGREFHFEASVSAYRARGPVRELIHRFKYEGGYYLRHELGQWALEAMADERLREPRPDGLVPVPLHPARQRQRGFNQAEVVARIVSQGSGVPLLRALKRIRNTVSQTTYEREERMENLRGVFRVRKNADVQQLHLILVDDVFTTGSTVDECARTLHEAGVASVRVLTIARG